MATRICKICGKSYEYCKSLRPTGIYRWQDVACCPEHASEYFAAIEASRKADEEKVLASNAPDYIEEDIIEDDDLIYYEEEEDDDNFI